MMLRRIVTLLRGVVAAGIVVLAVARPANAAMSAKISTSQPSHVGTCPVQVPFTGSITGTSGTKFTYSFRRVANGVPQIVNGATVTMPTSGSIAVKDAITISTSTAGPTFDQLWVHNISGNQPDVNSNKATYSVNCIEEVPRQGGQPAFHPLVTLRPEWIAGREYEYKWVGLSAYVPERGTGPCGGLCIGWNHIHQGDSLALYHWNTYDRAFIHFNPNAIKGLHVTKATLSLEITSGDPACYGGIGRAVLTRVPIVTETTQTFHAPYPDDGDFNWPTPAQFTGMSATIDVTGIVQVWASGKAVNQGFVLRGKLEDNGSDGNDSCSLVFGRRHAVLTIEQ